MNYLLFFLAIPCGYLLGCVGMKLAKSRKIKSDAIRGILAGLPFAVLAIMVVLVDMFL